MSYGDELQILDLSSKGIRLVTGTNSKDGGSNGSGKSTAVVDAICYGLFGKTTKRLKADEIVNHLTNKNCYVEVNFKVGQNYYSVKRYRKDEEYSNALLFEVNGEDASGEGKTDTQVKIESVIGISYKSFISGIVLSQEKVANFADADPLERRKIIENLLMYDFISKYHKASKEILRVITPEINTLSRSIKDKKETVKTLTENLLDYIGRQEDKEENRQSKINELKSEKEKLEKIDTVKETNIRVEIRKLDSEVSDIEDSIDTINQKIVSEKKLINNTRPKIVSREAEVNDIKENPDVCPVCSNIIEKEKLESYVASKSSEIEEFKNELKTHQEKYDALVQQLEDTEKEFNSKEQRLQELKASISKDLNDEDIEHSIERINAINSEIKYLENDELDLENDEWIKNTSKNIEEHKKKLKKLKKKVNHLEEEKEYYEWWKTALGNSPSSIKSFAINQVLTSFNKYINYYLGFFGYDLNYSLDEQLEESIIKDDYETSFGSFSGGEKRALEISLVFALYEIIRLKLPDSVNILVLDELLSTSLDDIRINSTMEILKELEERGLSIFVIDHKSTLKDNLDCSTILVHKDEDGISRLETV